MDVEPMSDEPMNDETMNDETMNGEPEIVLLASPGTPGPDGALTETVSEPAKVMRVGSMVKQLLDEVKSAPLDDRSRERLALVYQRSIDEVAGALSPDLADELRSMALPFEPGVVPSDAELRVAQAQLVGWLEGLFHGIQATLFAQQIAARQQLEQMRSQLGPGGMRGIPTDGAMAPGDFVAQPPERPGTYL
jgi:hypothetical protein